MNVGSKQVEFNASGGAKRKVKKVDDKKKTQSKQSTQSKKQSNSQDKKKSSKKGGAIVDDVKNLAVPFAILLAKEGLSKMFPKGDAKKSVKSLNASSASKPSSSRRRTTMSGGSCNLGCTAQTGGQAAKQLFELQNEIDHFLQKY